MRLHELLILLEDVDSIEAVTASVLKRPKMVAGMLANAKSQGFDTPDFAGSEDPENHPKIIAALVKYLSEYLTPLVKPQSYLRWLTYRAAEDERAFHRQIGHLLKAFESARDAGTATKRSINEYKTLEEFINEYMQPAVRTLSMHQEIELHDVDLAPGEHFILQSREKMIKQDEAEMLFSDDQVDLVLIKTFDAAIAFGSRVWCTAQQEGHWDSYNNGTFAVIVFKENPFKKIYAVQANGAQFQTYENDTLSRRLRRELLDSLPDEVENILVDLADTDSGFLTTPDAKNLGDGQLAEIIASGYDEAQYGEGDEDGGFDEELYDEAILIFQEYIKQSPENEDKYVEMIIDATLEHYQAIPISDILWRINEFVTSPESLSKIMLRLASQLHYQSIDESGDLDSRENTVNALLNPDALKNDIESGEFDIRYYLDTEVVYLYEVHNVVGDELLIKLIDDNDRAMYDIIKSMLSAESLRIAEYNLGGNDVSDIGDIFDTLDLAIRHQPELAEYTDVLKTALGGDEKISKRLDAGEEISLSPIMLRMFPDVLHDNLGTTFEIIAADKPGAISALVDTNRLTHGKLNYSLERTDGTTMLKLAKILKDHEIEIPGDIALKMVRTILNTATNPPPPKEGTYEEVPYLLKFANTKDLSFA